MTITLRADLATADSPIVSHNVKHLPKLSCIQDKHWS